LVRVKSQHILRLWYDSAKTSLRKRHAENKRVTENKRENKRVRGEQKAAELDDGEDYEGRRVREAAAEAIENILTHEA
jgi:hypothetical protein